MEEGRIVKVVERREGNTSVSEAGEKASLRRKVMFADHESEMGFLRVYRPREDSERKLGLEAAKILKENAEHAKRLGISGFGSSKDVSILFYSSKEDELSEEERMIQGLNIGRTIFVNSDGADPDSMKETIAHGFYHAISRRGGIVADKMSLRELAYNEAGAELYAAGYIAGWSNGRIRAGRLLDALSADVREADGFVEAASRAALRGPERFERDLPTELLKATGEVFQYLTKVEKAQEIGRAMACIALATNSMDYEKSINEVFRNDYPGFANALYKRIGKSGIVNAARDTVREKSELRH